MTEASPRRAHSSRSARALHRATLIALIFLIGLLAGCEQEAQQSNSPVPIDSSHIRIVAWLNAESPCQQGTIEILDELEASSPERLNIRLVDIGTPEGLQRQEEHGLDVAAVEIEGNTTVTWGEGDSRRTVTFMHPAGFTWTHQDLREAIEAALEGGLLPADPAEAEGVRLMHVTARGQSIRTSAEGAETGQLVIQDEIVLELTQAHGEFAPGQRVTAAADALAEVLQKPFTPNLLTIQPAADGVAVMAGETPVLTATEADCAGGSMRPSQLAESWRRAVWAALIDAALKRAAAPEPQPQSEPVQALPAQELADTPEDVLADPLQPTIE